MCFTVTAGGSRPTCPAGIDTHTHKPDRRLTLHSHTYRTLLLMNPKKRCACSQSALPPCTCHIRTVPASHCAKTSHKILTSFSKKPEKRQMEAVTCYIFKAQRLTGEQKGVHKHSRSAVTSHDPVPAFLFTNALFEIQTASMGDTDASNTRPADRQRQGPAVNLARPNKAIRGH